MTFGPGVDHLIGDHQERRDHGREQKRRGTVRAADRAEGGSDQADGALSADDAGMFGRLVDVDKTGHDDFPSNKTRDGDIAEACPESRVSPDIFPI